MPFRKTGRALRRGGWMRASQLRNRHQPQTNMNCTSVRVTGLEKAIKIALEDVLDKMDVAYQMAQRSFEHLDQPCVPGNDETEHDFIFLRTMSFPEMGALRASAMSCAFWLTLCLRVRTPRIASVKLFCRPCLAPPGGPACPLPWPHAFPFERKSLFLRGCQRSPNCTWLFDMGRGRWLGLGVREPSASALSGRTCRPLSSKMSGNL